MINFSSLERLSLEEPMPKVSTRANALLLISSEKEWVYIAREIPFSNVEYLRRTPERRKILEKSTGK